MAAVRRDVERIVEVGEEEARNNYLSLGQAADEWLV